MKSSKSCMYLLVVVGVRGAGEGQDSLVSPQRNEGERGSSSSSVVIGSVQDRFSLQNSGHYSLMVAVCPQTKVV